MTSVRVALSSLVLLCTLYQRVRGEGETIPELLEVDHTNLEETINRNPYLLISFYAPWCGHCKRLEPVLQVVQKQCKENKVNFKLVKYNADTPYNKKLARLHGATRFPTVKVFNHGEEYEYQGMRHWRSIYNYLKKISSPAILDLPANRKSEFPPEGGDAIHSSFLYFGLKSEETFQRYEEIAEFYKNRTWFGSVENPSSKLLAEYEVEKIPCLLSVYDGAQYSEAEVLYLDESSVKMKHFIDTHLIPPIHSISSQTYPVLAERNVPIFFTALDYDTSPKRKDFLDSAKSLVKKYRESVIFGYVDTKELGSWLQRQFDVKPGAKFPLFFLYDPQNQKYKNLTPENTGRSLELDSELIETILKKALSDETPWTFAGPDKLLRSLKEWVSKMSFQALSKFQSLWKDEL